MQAYEQFEIEFAQFVGRDAECVVACSSGTAALHLAFESLRIGKTGLTGSNYREIFCPEYTMVACPRAIVMAGYNPLFVDCDKNLLMDLDLVSEELLSDRHVCHGVLAVHIYGRRVDMNRLHSLVEPDGLFVVEDMAEAHAFQPHEETDAACYSFYRNKIIGGEEGGCVVFLSPLRAQYARELRSLGFTKRHDFNHRPRGHNYRMSNLHAHEILEGKNGLRKFGENLTKRWAILNEYDRQCPTEWRMPERQAPWIYDIRIDGVTMVGQKRLIVTALNEAGIAARHGFVPMTQQEEFCNGEFRLLKSLGHYAWHNAIKHGQDVIYLPIDPHETTPEKISESFRVIREVLRSE